MLGPPVPHPASLCRATSRPRAFGADSCPAEVDIPGEQPRPSANHLALVSASEPDAVCANTADRSSFFRVPVRMEKAKPMFTGTGEPVHRPFRRLGAPITGLGLCVEQDRVKRATGAATPQPRSNPQIVSLCGM